MFRPVFIEARDLDDCWFQLLSACADVGRKYKITSGSYEGHYRYALDFVSCFIHYPHTRPLSPQIPPTCQLPPPTTDDEIEKYFYTYLMDPRLSKNEHYKYATWIVGGAHQLPPVPAKYSPDGLRTPAYEVLVPNQLQWVIDHFKNKGLGNEHCYITIGYPESNFAYEVPYSNHNERRTSPCLRGLDFRVIKADGEYYLTTHVVYRSWDLVSGWPTNMGGFTLLNEYVAGEIGVNPGALSCSCKSLHCYDFAFDYLKARLAIH